MYIKPKTYYHWRTLVKNKCDQSAIFLCVIRHPNQVTSQEVNKIKKLLADERFQYWPIASVWGYAVKYKLVVLSKATWYHYNKLLGLRKATSKLDRSSPHP